VYVAVPDEYRAYHLKCRKFGGMVHIKITQLIMAASMAAASVVGFAGIAAAAAPATSTVCAEGALAIVTDDSGVQHEACVASAVVIPAPTATESVLAPASPVQTVSTTPTTSSPELPKTGSSSIGLLIAALLVGSGSVASLLSRRKP
jgi:LPXTG-motif cell wall-anchored protein